MWLEIKWITNGLFAEQRSPIEHVGASLSLMILNLIRLQLISVTIYNLALLTNIRIRKMPLLEKTFWRQEPHSDIFMAFSLWQDNLRFCFSLDLPRMVSFSVTSPFGCLFDIFQTSLFLRDSCYFQVHLFDIVKCWWAEMVVWKGQKKRGGETFTKSMDGRRLMLRAVM